MLERKINMGLRLMQYAEMASLMSDINLDDSPHQKGGDYTKVPHTNQVKKRRAKNKAAKKARRRRK